MLLISFLGLISVSPGAIYMHAIQLVGRLIFTCLRGIATCLLLIVLCKIHEVKSKPILFSKDQLLIALASSTKSYFCVTRVCRLPSIWINIRYGHLARFLCLCCSKVGAWNQRNSKMIDNQFLGQTFLIAIHYTGIYAADIPFIVAQ
jgi:hypothetical protein